MGKSWTVQWYSVTGTEKMLISHSSSETSEEVTAWRGSLLLFVLFVILCYSNPSNLYTDLGSGDKDLNPFKA